jgi:hypothetical protein
MRRHALTTMDGHAHHPMAAAAAEISHFSPDFQAFVRKTDSDMARMMADMHGPG